MKWEYHFNQLMGFQTEFEIVLDNGYEKSGWKRVAEMKRASTLDAL